MSFMSNFTSITNINPKQIVTNLVGNQINKFLGGRTSSGPLAALANPKRTLQMLQYPQDLGESSGPFINWVKFNILESVAVAGADAYTGELGGASNAFGLSSKSGADLINKAIGTVNSKVSEAVGAKDLLASVGLNATSLLSPKRRVRATSTVISLYIPNQMVFNQNNNYSDLSLTQQLGVVLQGLNASESINAKGLPGSAGPVAELAGQLTGLSEGNLLLYGATGTVLNPQFEVIFQQTDLRTFQFDFVLAARSRDEMDAIHQIVAMFRMAAAPKIAGSDGRYLIPPDEFDIEFMFNGGNVPMIPRISTCVLTNITTDFAPSGQYAVFDDGRPVSTRLTLQFKEVDLIHKGRVEQGY